MDPKPFFVPVATWLWMRRKGLIDSWIKETSPVIENLVVLSDGYGVNLIMRHLQGDPLLPLVIDNASIGTGSTAPAATDTDLETPVVTGIIRATGTLTAPDTLVTEWFITNDELPNGTYNEFGLKCGTRLWARSIISPSHTKASNEDTLIEYTTEGSVI